MNPDETQDPGTSEGGTGKVLKFPLHVGREPIDLAEWPVVTLAHAPIREPIVIPNTIGHDEMGIPQDWELALRNVALGAPIAGDQDIYVAVMALLHETDFRERVLRITRADLCRVLEWHPSDKKYLRIQDALSRFRNVTYKGKNIFKDPKTGERFGYIEFGFVDSFAFSDRPPKRRKGADQPELPLSYVRLADEFLILCRQANLKLIDLDFYRSLSRPETRWLYRFLDKNFYKRSEYRIGLRKLRRRQGLLSTLDPKFIKRDHKPRLEELKAKGFLRDWRFEKSNDPEDPWNLWVAKDPTYGLRRLQRRSDGPTPQEAEKRTSDERITPKTATPESSLDQLVAYFSLRQLGIEKTAATAGERKSASVILEHAGGDSEIARSIVDFAIAEAKQTDFNMRNIAGVLTNSYPERAVAARVAQAERTARAEQARRAEDDMQREKDVVVEKAKVAFDTLPAEDREQLVGEARKKLHPFIQRTPDQWPQERILDSARHEYVRNAIDIWTRERFRRASEPPVPTPNQSPQSSS